MYAKLRIHSSEIGVTRTFLGLHSPNLAIYLDECYIFWET